MGRTRHPVRFALAASLLLLLAAPRACDAASSLKAAENKLREQGLLLHDHDSSASRRARDADAGFAAAKERPPLSPAESKFRAARDALEGSAARFSRRKAHAVRALREVLALEPRHREAMTCLGRAYQTGEGVEQDDAEALRLFREAAALGDPGAHEELGFAHGVGWYGLERSTAKAVLHQYFAAMGGDPLAQMAMGFRHLRGAGVPESCQSAALYYDPPASSVADTTNAKGASFTGASESAGGRNGAVRLTAETSPAADPAPRRGRRAVLQVQRRHGQRRRGERVGRLLTFGARGVEADQRSACCISRKPPLPATLTPWRAWATCSPTASRRRALQRDGARAVPRRQRQRRRARGVRAGVHAPRRFRGGARLDEGVRAHQRRGGGGVARGAVPPGRAVRPRRVRERARGERKRGRRGRGREPSGTFRGDKSASVRAAEAARPRQGVLQLQPRGRAGARHGDVQPRCHAAQRLAGPAADVQERVPAAQGPGRTRRVGRQRRGGARRSPPAQARAW